MENKRSLSRRWEEYRVSKTALFWSCAGCAVATMIVGFSWGGWVTGGTAEQMATKAEASGRADVAAMVCVSRFASGADAGPRLVSLKASNSWDRNDVLEKGGWVTLAGMDKPVTGASKLCADRLLATETVPAAKAS